ncbi:MAG: GFA family protein [Sandaracinaceae bacterium]|nr:GFA family protein [Sandaracinaceae bacterium]
MSDTFEGSCHCGAVRFRVRARELCALDCNCSICTKKGFLHLIVRKEDFELLRGEDALSEYRFHTGVARHTFCRTCGIHPFYTPRSHPDGVDVNVRCLDEGALERFTIEPFDGRRWEENVESIRERS